MAVPDVVTRYFEADARHDFDALVALFTEDAEVVDESRTRRGAEEIRAWRAEVATKYRYTTEVRGAEDAGGGAHVVTGRIEGDFPGGVADLTWRFTLAGDRIRRLAIG
jgi:ketosteroid isomerase-like protein